MHLLCIAFQGELQGHTDLVPSNFIEILHDEIIVESEYSMLNVVNEGMRVERGMDCTFQAPEQDGPGCHTVSAASVSHI